METARRSLLAIPNGTPKSKGCLIQIPKALVSLGQVCFLEARGLLSDKTPSSLNSTRFIEATPPPT